MGDRTVMQEALFYSFSLERHVPADHLLRSIERFVDLSGIREHLRPYYSETGRPSVDPELMIRMLLVGYCFGIRSERRLCEEVHLNIAYRWFCRKTAASPAAATLTPTPTSRPARWARCGCPRRAACRRAAPSPMPMTRSDGRPRVLSPGPAPRRLNMTRSGGRCAPCARATRIDFACSSLPRSRRRPGLHQQMQPIPTKKGQTS